MMTADAVGGVWTYAMELIAALRPHGVDVVLAIMGPRPSAAQFEQASRLANVRLHWLDVKLEWMPDPWDDVARAGGQLLELARRESPDLIHLNGYVHASAPWGRPVLVVAHSCVCSWWEAVYGEPAPREWDAYRERVAAGVRASHAVVAPTRAFLDDFTRRYRPTAPDRVIHNGRSPEPFTCNEPRAREPLIFSCSRIWDPAKNMQALNAAACALPWPVYVAGDSETPHGASCRFEHLKCIGTVSQTDVAAWLQRAAIYAHPARYEPFGLSVLEAALAGCALVLADLPTLRELWDGAALFVPAGEVYALRGALLRLIEDPELRGRLARQSAARARIYGPQCMASKYMSVYRSLRGRGAGRETAVA